MTWTRKQRGVMGRLERGRSENARESRRGVAAVAIVVLLITVDLIIVSLVLSGGRDHELTVRRLETVAAAYAAEAGVNMSIRELMESADEDSDGAIGSISDDGNNNNDPDLGNATVRVTISADDPLAGQTTVSSEGRSGMALRKMTTVIE